MGVKILSFTMLKLNEALACTGVQQHMQVVKAAHARNTGACCSYLCARFNQALRYLSFASLLRHLPPGSALLQSLFCCSWSSWFIVHKEITIENWSSMNYLPLELVALRGLLHINVWQEVCLIAKVSFCGMRKVSSFYCSETDRLKN